MSQTAHQATCGRSEDDVKLWGVLMAVACCHSGAPTALQIRQLYDIMLELHR